MRVEHAKGTFADYEGRASSLMKSLVSTTRGTTLPDAFFSIITT